MFLALWEYEVKPGCEERFETVYGPEGDWAQLFRRDGRYQETRLLRDPLRPGVYITLDFWSSRKDYEEFKATHCVEYEKIDAVGEGLTVRERCVGVYESIEP
jgi:heme-degrading monooxygenase HmoA